MGTLITVALVMLAILLFFAAKQGWIHNETLQTGANVAAIIVLIAAIAVFVVPVPAPVEPPSDQEFSELEPTSTKVATLSTQPPATNNQNSDNNSEPEPTSTKVATLPTQPPATNNQNSDNNSEPEPTSTKVATLPTQPPATNNQNSVYSSDFYASENRNIDGLEIAFSPPNLLTGCSRTFDVEVTLNNKTENPIVLGFDERDIAFYGNGTDKLSLYGDMGAASPRCYGGFDIETMAPNSSLKFGLGTRDSLGNYNFVDVVFGDGLGRLSGESWRIDLNKTDGWNILSFGESISVDGLIITVGEETYFPGCNGTFGFAVSLENTTNSPIILSLNRVNLNLYGNADVSMSLFSQEGPLSTECYNNRVDIETIGAGEKLQIATRTTKSLSGLNFVEFIIEAENRLDGLRWHLELPR